MTKSVHSRAAEEYEQMKRDGLVPDNAGGHREVGCPERSDEMLPAGTRALAQEIELGEQLDEAVREALIKSQGKVKLQTVPLGFGMWGEVERRDEPSARSSLNESLGTAKADGDNAAGFTKGLEAEDDLIERLRNGPEGWPLAKEAADALAQCRKREAIYEDRCRLRDEALAEADDLIERLRSEQWIVEGALHNCQGEREEAADALAQCRAEVEKHREKIVILRSYRDWLVACVATNYTGHTDPNATWSNDALIERLRDDSDQCPVCNIGPLLRVLRHEAAAALALERWKVIALESDLELYKQAKDGYVEHLAILTDRIAELEAEVKRWRGVGEALNKANADTDYWKGCAQAHNDSLVDRIKENEGLRAENGRLKARPCCSWCGKPEEIPVLRAEAERWKSGAENDGLLIDNYRARVAELERALEKIQETPYRDIGALMHIARAALENKP